jgi:hypothetical protein
MALLTLRSPGGERLATVVADTIKALSLQNAGWIIETTKQRDAREKAAADEARAVADEAEADRLADEAEEAARDWRIHMRSDEENGRHLITDAAGVPHLLAKGWRLASVDEIAQHNESVARHVAAVAESAAVHAASFNPPPRRQSIGY